MTPAVLTRHLVSTVSPTPPLSGWEGKAARARAGAGKPWAPPRPMGCAGRGAAGPQCPAAAAAEAGAGQRRDAPGGRPQRRDVRLLPRLAALAGGLRRRCAFLPAARCGAGGLAWARMGPCLCLLRGPQLQPSACLPPPVGSLPHPCILLCSGVPASLLSTLHWGPHCLSCSSVKSASAPEHLSLLPSLCLSLLSWPSGGPVCWTLGGGFGRGVACWEQVTHPGGWERPEARLAPWTCCRDSGWAGPEARAACCVVGFLVEGLSWGAPVLGMVRQLLLYG